MPVIAVKKHRAASRSTAAPLRVVEVLDAWLAPDHRYFKVSGDNGTYYILGNDVVTGRWELTMFDRTRAIG